MGMPLLIFVAAETGVYVPLPSKLTSVAAAIQLLGNFVLNRCLSMDYSVIIS
jgi:hypothetical protein